MITEDIIINNLDKIGLVLLLISAFMVLSEVWITYSHGLEGMTGVLGLSLLLLKWCIPND